jgi:gamma-glutamyltranspeptidase/glutathione hydrolase
LSSARGAVAAGHPATAEAAELILREGGNAFDAIVAGTLAACVAEPVLVSLGGGGFLLGRTRAGRSGALDFFVQTPRGKRPKNELDFEPVTADFGAAQQVFHIGQGAIATPGLVRGLFTVQRELGRLPMRSLAAPAVALAREGVVLNALQAYIFSVVAPIYTATPEARALFQDAEGRLLGEGARYRNPELADLIEALAAEGEDLFYRGEVAALIDEACASGGGHLRREDLEQYTVQWREPLAIPYRDARLLTTPPPASGGLLIGFGLRLLEALGPELPEFGSADYAGHLVDVMDATRRARAELGGPDPGLLDAGLLARYAEELAGRPAALRGTTHLSVADGRGNLAALTASNGEGCGHLLPGTGLMLNNMLGEDDLNPGGFHRWAPDTRMTSMMAPSLLELADGRTVVMGSGGSNRIRTALLQVVLQLVDFGLDIEEAVVRPRLHFEGGDLAVEGGFDAERLAPLLARHCEHTLWDAPNLFFGGVHAVVRDGEALRGAGDPRRGGVCRVI